MTREEMLNECVSRDKAIVQLNHLKSDWDDDWNIAIRKCIETIKKLPSVSPQPCEDAISRQAVNDLQKYRYNCGDTTITCVSLNSINELPTVTPQSNTGKWLPIEYDGYADGSPVWDKWECSECGCEHNGDEESLTAFCPDCGRKMEVGENG